MYMYIHDLYSLHCRGVMVYVKKYTIRIHGFVDEYPLSTLSMVEVT